MIRRALLAAALVLALAACSEQPAGEPLVRARLDGSLPEEPPSPAPAPSPSAAAASACRKVRFEEVPLTVCTADPARHRITMALLGPGGQPFGSLEAFAKGREPATVAFAMNGGAYGNDLRPIGYYVENGERLAQLNRASGEGNFYIKPNGVFFGNGTSGWRVLATDTFFETIATRPQFGTQSGPLLVVDGQLPPTIQDNGPSKAIRNAVGVDAEGKAHFVIADAPLSFGQLARYFRDELKVGTALCLDSQVSSLWDPASGRIDKGRIGPIILVEQRAGKEAGLP
jgi:uncharacterized protein YigE (DUF2233 family)